MSTKVCWKVSFSASCVHIAAAIRSGLPWMDPQKAAQMSVPAQALFHELESTCGSVERPLWLLLAFASEEENNRRLAELVLVKLLGRNSVSQTAIQGLAGRLSDLEAAQLRENPQCIDELAVRSGPLRAQWDTLGPGMLRQVGILTDEGVIPEMAEIVLVLPCLGGHGDAHLQQQRVTFEGVLTNPHEDLPEVLRMAWLVSQLNMDLPKYRDVLPPERWQKISALAMLPPVLVAADRLGTICYQRQLLTRALEAWHVEGVLPSEDAARLEHWWSTVEEVPVKWPVALVALDQMLAS